MNPSRLGGRRRLSALVASYVTATLLAGCGFLLPEAEETTESPWTDYQTAKAAFDKITPYLSTDEDLKELGFDPFKSPNISILSYLDVIHKFMPNDSIRPSDLDEGVRACIAAREACHAYEVTPSDLHSERIGTAFLDVLNFKRHTVKSGWSFKATILLKDGLVMYKLWNGKPVIREQQRKVNPLGPLQSPADLVIDKIP